MIHQIKDKCSTLVAGIRATDRSQRHWERKVVSLAATARHELKTLRQAARAPGVNRDGLLVLVGQLEAELDQALENHAGGR